MKHPIIITHWKSEMRLRLLLVFRARLLSNIDSGLWVDPQFTYPLLLGSLDRLWPVRGTHLEVHTGGEL